LTVVDLPASEWPMKTNPAVQDCARRMQEAGLPVREQPGEQNLVGCEQGQRVEIAA